MEDGGVKLTAIREFQDSVGTVEYGQVFEADGRTAARLLAAGYAQEAKLATKAVLMASGPSLVEEDIERVRIWREASPEAMVLVTNLTFRAAPWADHLYCLDGLWWREYGPEARATFKGRMWTPSVAASEMFGATLVTMRKRARGLSRSRGVMYGCNSGRHLIDLAYQLGARRMVLLGYDMGPTKAGREHWHEPYPADVRMTPAYGSWARELVMVAQDLKALGVNVLNCSRRTSLSAFRIESLDESFVTAES